MEENDANHTLRRNKKTFILALSSLCSLDEESNGCNENDKKSTFCADSATKLVRDMKECSERYKDEDLQPDTEVYNAPLPWSGGVYRITPTLSTNSWDDYAFIFHKGFRPLDANNLLVKSAINMENWVYKMESAAMNKSNICLHPNIETYESIIQAWVRTGTVEGMERAESWAMRAVDAGSSCVGISPRLQTFHPIFAGWSCSGMDMGATRVTNLLNELERLSTSNHHLKPDGRIYASIIMTLKNNNKFLSSLKVSNKNDEDERISMFQTINKKSYRDFDSLEIARHSSECLKNIYNITKDAILNEKSPLHFVDGKMFLDSVDTWKNVGELKNRNDSDSHESFESIFQIASMLDDLVDSSRNKLSSSFNSSEDHHNQVSNLMLHSYLVYQNIINYLCTNEMCQKRISVSKIEEILRRLYEYDQVIQSNPSEFEYHDLFKYEKISNTDEMRMSPLFYKDVLKCCTMLDADKNCGDIIRILTMILSDIEIKNSRREQFTISRNPYKESFDLSHEVARVLTLIVPNVIERRLLFCRMVRYPNDTIDNLNFLNEMTMRSPSDERFLIRLGERLSSNSLATKETTFRRHKR
eukprot:CAMPEP_0184860528 /NCGR_PEP_ID=MMETSP0580-20130426/5403_1 /TAXON_ID=1118495 /ORGANISM="Dactyliosolen fragilissimus" /LENGTH=585 /DNA_ID=CAMNT_0027357667 /DNA_START=757 /DNA_END=2514 /DNA_ORIENTATION=-